MLEKINKKVQDILSFIQGNLRYKLFYSKFAFLIPQHIKEQIEYRISIMDRKCYEDGQCKICGCTTTALQMANKSCPKPCYPKLMNVDVWKTYQSGQLTLNGFNYGVGKNKD